MKKLWGGAHREEGPNYAESFGESFMDDMRFWCEDVTGSIAHARMLGETGVVSKREANTLVKGLKQILKEGEPGLYQDAEDIHTAVEMRLREIVGDVAGKLHTARSRNDQVATDTRMYVRRSVTTALGVFKRLQAVLLAQAEAHRLTLMPGMTHGQHAQPVTLGFHLLAHFWAFQRHGWRHEQLLELLNYSPLGSAALSGTSFPIERRATARELGFISPIPNALDATSDRSFVMDAIHLSNLVMIDLSRMSQEIVLWTSPEYGWMTLSDSFTTGSSIMPQKRNPDIAELIRGRSAGAVGCYVSISTMLKGLALGYNRDTQLDKTALYAAEFDAVQCTQAMWFMLESATFDTDRMAAATKGDFSTATDLADFLAKKGVPFREAHRQVGKIVRACTDRKIGLEDLTPELLKKIAPKVPKEALKVLDPRASVNSRESEGGTGPKAVAKQIRQAKALLKAEGFKKPY